MTTSEADLPPMTTSIGRSTADGIWVQGHDLASELMGEVDFGGAFYLLVTGRLPGPGESVLFNAILVALADHGLTPSALAARLTHLGAPEAVQGAVAAGLLGAGSGFLGVFENAGRMLREVNPARGDTDARLDELARDLIADHRERSVRLPGLGHPFHKGADPRVTRLLALGQEHDLIGPHTRLIMRIQEIATTSSGASLPLNAGGMCGALLCDLGIDTTALRGVAIVSRAAGLVGHLVEEARTPLAKTVWLSAERDVEHLPRREDETGGDQR